MASPITQDWATNPDPISRAVLIVFRFGQYAHQHRWALAVYWPLNLIVCRLLAGCDIPRQTRIGPRLRLMHAGRGVCINRHAIIGSDVTLYQGTVIGASTDDTKVPTIGDRATVGVYGVILGPVTIGTDARIGPHTVVMCDVPEGATVRSPDAQMPPTRRPGAPTTH